MVQPRGEMHQKNTKLFKFISLQEPVQKYEHPRDIFHSENLLQHLFTRQSIYRARSGSVQSQSVITLAISVLIVHLIDLFNHPPLSLIFVKI